MRRPSNEELSVIALHSKDKTLKERAFNEMLDKVKEREVTVKVYDDGYKMLAYYGDIVGRFRILTELL